MRYKLFIGNYRSLDKEHIESIQSVLDRGGNVCVGLQVDNPDSIRNRINMFRDVFPDEMHSMRVRVILIPDIEKIERVEDISV